MATVIEPEALRFRKRREKGLRRNEDRLDEVGALLFLATHLIYAGLRSRAVGKRQDASRHGEALRGVRAKVELALPAPLQQRRRSGHLAITRNAVRQQHGQAVLRVRILQAVHMHIQKSRYQELAACINSTCRCRCTGLDGSDLAAGDSHHCVRGQLARSRVDHGDVVENECAGRTGHAYLPLIELTRLVRT